MSGIADTLNNLFTKSVTDIRVLSDMNNEVIQTEPNLRYYLCNINNTTVKLEKCKQLRLLNCKNLKIVSSKLPIMGVHMLRTDNTKMDILHNNTKDSGSGYISSDNCNQAKIILQQKCLIDVNQCVNIVVNDINISDEYVDSTWEMTHENDL